MAICQKTRDNEIEDLMEYLQSLFANIDMDKMAKECIIKSIYLRVKNASESMKKNTWIY